MRGPWLDTGPGDSKPAGMHNPVQAKLGPTARLIHLLNRMDSSAVVARPCAIVAGKRPTRKRSEGVPGVSWSQGPKTRIHLEVGQIFPHHGVFTKWFRQIANGGLHRINPYWNLTAEVLDVAAINLVIANEFAGDELRNRSCFNRQISAPPENDIRSGSSKSMNAALP